MFFNKISSLLFIIIYFISILSTLLPNISVSAAGPATWKDVDDIKLGEDSYRDSDPFDGTVNFKHIDSDGCEDEIKGFDGSTTIEKRADTNVKGLNKIKSGGGACNGREQDLNLTNPENRFIFFRFVDEGTIEKASSLFSGLGPFVRDGSCGEGRYCRVSENGDECQDFISLQSGETPDGSGRRAILVERQTNGPGRGSAPNGCFYSTTSDSSDAYQYDLSTSDLGLNMFVGNTENQSIPSGDGTLSDPSDSRTGDDPADETDDTPRCEESFDFPGAWIVCLVLTTISGTVDKMVDAIADMLSVNRAEINDDGLKAAWSYFRNIASVLLVVIGLVMIIGQAVSKE